MSGQLTQWAGHMADLGQAEKQVKNPPWWKTLSGSVEAEAIEIFAAKRKAEDMRKELKSYISFTMGPSAWDELIAIEGKIRKQKKEQEYRKAELKEEIITWTLGVLLFTVGLGIMAFVLYMVV